MDHKFIHFSCHGNTLHVNLNTTDCVNQSSLFLCPPYKYQENASIRLRPLPYKSFLFNYSQTILPFGSRDDAVGLTADPRSGQQMDRDSSSERVNNFFISSSRLVLGPSSEFRDLLLPLA
jgi:hypothetical protein